MDWHAALKIKSQSSENLLEVIYLEVLNENVRSKIVCLWGFFKDR